MVIQTSTQAQTPSHISKELSQQIKLLNALSERRRVNTFFINEQSSFYGLQKGFVNVGRGNVTFVRRDMVTAGRIPIVIARIYDSSAIKEDDFSLGWQLSLAETIELKTNGRLLYRDDSAVLNTFVPSTVGYKINPAQNADIQSVMFNDRGLIHIDYLTGWRKEFQQLGDKYRLTSIIDNNNNRLQLSYNDDRLSQITSANNRSISIRRDNKGRITQITDDNNRTVNYHYNRKDLLNKVTDLGANQWHYRYHSSGLLHQIIDPLNQSASIFRFDKNQRASTVDIRAKKYRYQYKGNKTKIKDEQGNTSTFIQNAQGITTSITNAEGFTSTITLNQRNQITELWHNDKQQAAIVYDDNGRPSHYDINPKPTQLETLTEDSYQQFNYHYDDQGQVIAITDNDTLNINYAYDERGNLTKHNNNGDKHYYAYATNGDVLSEKRTITDIPLTQSAFDYDADGLLTTLTTQNKTTHFAYHANGKLRQITFPNGANHQYTYDPLGFRRQTQRSDSSATDYLYDSLGNLQSSTKTDTKQQRIAETHHINALNQITTIDITHQQPMIVAYTSKGEPQSVTRGSHTKTFSYDKLGRLINVFDSETGQSSYQYKKGEVDIRLQLDERTRPQTSYLSRVSSHNQTQIELNYARLSGSPWQAVVWHESLNKLMVPSPETLHAPNEGYKSGIKRRRLRDALSIKPLTQQSFDKDSNSFFLPGEYSAIGCVIMDDDEQNCNGSISHLVLTLPTNNVVGSSGIFSANTGHNSACIPEFKFAFHNYGAANKTGIFYVPFTTVGTFTAVVTAECCGSIKWFRTEFTVTPQTLTGVGVSTPTGVIGYINRNRTMPSISFSATSLPSTIPINDITFHWYLDLAYTEHGKNFHHRVPSTGTVNIKGSDRWQPQWGGLLAGSNNITVYLSATHGSKTTAVATSSGYQIQGENPTKVQIFGIASSIEAKAVCWQESSHRQFSGTAYTGKGSPLFGSPDGWGLMQRDPLQGESHLWDWRASLSSGVSYLNIVHTDAQNYLNTWYNAAASTPDTTDDWAWDPRTQNSDRVWNDAFSRYNTGNPVYSPNGNQGVLNCSRNQPGCNYATAVRNHINHPQW